MGLRIRKANPSDYINVRDFYYELTDAMEKTKYKPGWQKDIYPTQSFLISSIEKNELYVGEKEERLVACMIINHAYNEGYKEVCWATDAVDGEFLVIHALGVAFEFSGQGIARKMAQYAVDYGRSMHMKSIRLDVLDGNIPAERAYVGIGFQYVDTLQMYYEDTGRTSYKLFELECEVKPVKKIAFVCVHNSCRSQIAEALGKKYFGDKYEFYSCGTVLKDKINPDAVRLMKEIYHIDMEKTQRPKLVSDIPKVDVVISMGCGAVCPYIGKDFDADWGLEDPTGKDDAAFKKIMAQIENYVRQMNF